MRTLSVRVTQKVLGTVREIGSDAQRPIAFGMCLDRGPDPSGWIILDPVLQMPAVLHEVVKIVLELY